MTGGGDGCVTAGDSNRWTPAIDQKLLAGDQGETAAADNGELRESTLKKLLAKHIFHADFRSFCCMTMRPDDTRYRTR
jgi:hypothetical protein